MSLMKIKAIWTDYKKEIARRFAQPLGPIGVFKMIRQGVEGCWKLCERQRLE